MLKAKYSNEFIIGRTERITFNNNYRMKSLSFTLLCAALLAMTVETKAERLDTLKTYELQNVQVTATRAQHNTPMTFSNLTQQELAKHNHGQDIPSLLSFMPSVTFTSDAGNGIGYTALKVRGTDPYQLHSQRNSLKRCRKFTSVLREHGRLHQ